MPPTDGRVLLVDDDAATRDVLASILDEVGFVVSAAGSQDEALELLATRQFDLILTDSFAAHPDHILTATAPLVTAAGRTPVVLLTAYQPNREEAWAAGFRDVILKPIGVDELEGRVQALLLSSDEAASDDHPLP